jgi:hypothetical protein
MRNLLYAATALGAVALAPAANATLLSIGLSTGGPITTEATSSIGTVSFTGSFNFWNVNQIQASDQSVLPAPGVLDSSSLDVSGPTFGSTLKVYITSQGLTNAAALQGFVSSFTSNLLDGNIQSVTEQTFVDDGNGKFALTTALGSANFTDIGTTSSTNFASLTAPFSATEVYTIVAQASFLGGTANSTIDLSTVPEPASLAMLGVGLLGLGFVTTRKRHV